MPRVGPPVPLRAHGACADEVRVGQVVVTWGMAVNTTHPDYDANLATWLRARDVLAGEDAVKAAGERYLPRLQEHTEEEYGAYRARAAFFNATARTAEGYLGLVFRRPPFVKGPATGSALGQAMEGAGLSMEVHFENGLPPKHATFQNVHYASLRQVGYEVMQSPELLALAGRS